MTLTREARLLQTFALLADTLVADYDVVDLLQMLVDTCRDVLEMTAAAILLADGRGDLEVIASTSESSRLVEMIQLSAEAGPCIESFRTGRPVSVPDIAETGPEWVRFRQSALDQGFRSVEALPLRLRDITIGTLNLMRSESGAPPREDLDAAQACARVATNGILHERTIRESAVLTEQLQAALNSRIVIEQAKGVISETRGVPIDEAFTLMRDYARAHRIGLSVVASKLVDRSITL